MVEGLHRLYLLIQLFAQVPWKDGRPVLASLAAADEDEVLPKVHILNPQADALHETQPAAVQELCHECMLALHGGKKALDLGLGKDRGRPWEALAAVRCDPALKRHVEDITVEKDKCV